MSRRFISIAALLVAVSGAAAQDGVPLRLELRPFAGVYVPTGSQADDFKTSSMFGLQAAMEFSPHFHLLGSLGWSDGRSKIAALSKDVTYIWQYDLGAEFNAYQEMGYGWLFRPFAGVGAGGRTYEYQANAVGNRTCTAGYGALGTEFQKASVALRLESRGYVNCFK
ncbi:MAG: outer membrane beta-barrel protein, partial [Gemmatimonadaceae bacterium]